MMLKKPNLLTSSSILLIFLLSLISVSRFAYADQQQALKASNAEQEWEALVKNVIKISGLKANFKQETSNGAGELIQSFSGFLAYQAPDKFIWQADEPVAQKLISDGITIWHYDMDLEQVLVQNYAEQAEQALLLSVLQNPQNLKQSFQLVSANVQGKLRDFQLQANSNQSEVQQINIIFTDIKHRGVTLSHFAFIDLLGQNTVISLSASDKKLSEKDFNFIIPDGVDVIYE